MLKTVSTQLALASDTLPEVLAKGNTTGGTDLAVSSGDDITFADNSKAIFGDGSDLQIYSDGATGQVTGSVVVTGGVRATGLVVNAGTDKVVLANNFDATGNTDSPKLAFYSFGDTATYPVTGPSIQKVNTTSYGAGDLVIYQHGPYDYTNETEALRIAHSTGAATFANSVTSNGIF
jgi:hypothetical protein